MEYILNDSYFSTDICKPDNLFMIDVQKSSVNLISENNLDCKIILVLLESPHYFEYKNKINTAAQNHTRNQLNKYLLKLIKNYQFSSKHSKIPYGKYVLTVDNAIQYQCSRGVETRYFRDQNWLYNWINRSMDYDLEQRIKTMNPEVIINLCTKGQHYNDNLKTVNITERYLKSFLGFKPNYKCNLVYNNKLIYNGKYIGLTKKQSMSRIVHPAFTSRNYYIKGFVQTLIDSTFNKLKLVGEVHPSSKKFATSKLYQV